MHFHTIGRGHMLAAVMVAATCFGAHAQGVLETPAPNSTHSGIGVISGWHCDAKVIEVFVDGNTARLVAGSRTDRADTAAVCGRSDTGFSVLFNWNILNIHCFGCANHIVEAYADGRKFAESRFRVDHFDTEYLTGKKATYTLSNFPTIGDETYVNWDESLQNFSIALTAPGSGAGASGIYYGALLTGPSNPNCYIGFQPPSVVKHGTFVIDGSSGQMTLSAQFADGTSCSLPSTPLEPFEQNNLDGYISAVFDSPRTASCAALPSGLRVRANGKRFEGSSLDSCVTVRARGAQ